MLIQLCTNLLKNKKWCWQIGWVGSHTTIKHFELITNVFKQLKNKYKGCFVVIDEKYKNDRLNIHGLKWENEQRLFVNSFDIGVMPLP